MKALDEKKYATIRELCAQGDALVEERLFEEAFACYSQALDEVPEPIEEWEATTWILSAIGDLYFTAGKTQKSLTAFEDAVRCPGGVGNPFIHLRLGECHYDLGHMEHAADELTQAFMGAGEEIFQKEDPKYLNFLKTRLKPSK